MPTKKILLFQALAALASLALTATASATVLDYSNNLYNTGVTATGVKVPTTPSPPTPDLHYTLIGVPQNQTEVTVTTPPSPADPAYVGAVYSGSPTVSTATEITPLAEPPGADPSEYPVGDYTYQLALNLYDVAPGNIVTITGTVVGDDGVPGIAGSVDDDMLTNVTGDGVNGSITSSYTDAENFSLTFTSGDSNAIDFTVYNSHGYTGLLVYNLKGSATPEPSAWALLIAGVGMLSFIAARRGREERI